MAINYHDLNYADHLQPSAGDEAQLHLVKAAGGMVQLVIPAGWYSIWMPIVGGLNVGSRETEWNLARRELLIWLEGGLRNRGTRGSWFLALCGHPRAWQRYLLTIRDLNVETMSLFPEHTQCSREARRLFVHLAQQARRSDANADRVDHLATALCNAIVEGQGDMRDYLKRCTGRTEVRRRHTLLRLLRVRHLISNNKVSRLDLQHLSEVANYSIRHLTRAYCEVFGETPSEHATRVRLKHAMDLVHGSTLTVREITDALGFESQSTFCRSFKREYGLTTTQARDSSRPAQRQPSSSGW